MRFSLPLSLLLGLNSLSLPIWAQQEPGPAPGPAPANPAPIAAPALPAAPNEAPPAAPNEAADNPARADLATSRRAVAPDAEAKRDSRKESSEMRFRAMMSDWGLEDSAKQDAVIVYIKEDEAGQNVVRGALRRLSFAMMHGANNGRIRDLIAVYKAALDADKERRAAARNALNAKIGFTLDARVEAVLWLFGVLGDGQNGALQNPWQRPSPGRGSTPNGSGNGNKARGNNANPGEEKAAKRPETILGTVENKGADWIELRDEQGKIERFSTFWTAADGETGTDRALVELVRTIPLHAPIRLTWMWNDRKRVVKIEPWTPDAKAPDAKVPDAPEPAPENAPDAVAKPEAAPK